LIQNGIVFSPRPGELLTNAKEALQRKASLTVFFYENALLSREGLWLLATGYQEKHLKNRQ